MAAKSDSELGKVYADGETIIENAACEPEIRDFGDFFNAMGANITGHGTPTIKIEGVRNLSAVTYTPIPDRIVAGTYMCAAALTGGEIEIENCEPTHLRIVMEKLGEMGVSLKTLTGGNILATGCPDPVIKFFFRVFSRFLTAF